jgi:UDP-N-acetyl-2-amino-2-deoxyglucuronate dehydrogenase
MRKLRIGIIGCGRVSACHFEAIARNADLLELAGVCDSDPANLSAAVALTGARGYVSSREMLAAERLDAVAVCTPNWLHFENAKEVLKAGASAIVEKPLALSYRHGKILFGMARKRGLGVFVIQQNRLNPTVQRVKGALERGEFGKIYMLASNVFWHRDERYYNGSAWHGSKKADGGAFVTQGSHYIDIMDWFAGAKAKSAYAIGGTRARTIETEDCGAAAIEWKNGIIGSISLSMLAYGGDYEGSITVQCEKGLVKIGGVALNKISDLRFEGNAAELFDSSYDVESVYGFGHTPYYRRIAESLLYGLPFLMGEEESLKSLRLLCGIAKSLDTGKPARFGWD